MQQPERTSPQTLRKLNVFISSPGDVLEERKTVLRILERFNKLQFFADHYILRPLAYEERVPAAVGQRPQSTVDRYMIQARDADIFICILCHRMGTPVILEQTGEQFQSGTEYEFLDAYQANQKSGKPVILLYQGLKPPAPGVDQEQLQQVRAFFRRFEGPAAEFQGLYKTYRSVQEFRNILFQDLDILIAKNFFPLEKNTSSLVTHELISRSVSHIDRGDAPHITQFYGREQEQADLRRWMVDERCKLVAVLGIGGMGKTTLAATLIERASDTFDFIYWRSLQDTPRLEPMLQKCIQFLSNQQHIDLPGDTDSQVALLLDYLRSQRCLIVLDNFESVLQQGAYAGQYRTDYEGYGKLIQRVGEANHQSCLLLTSREKPKEIARMEGKTSPTRSLQLLGMQQSEGQELLQDRGLQGSDATWASLVRLYTGNPLALKLVSSTIQELFEGDIAAFLTTGEVILGDIQSLIEQQFDRLSELEKHILYWLAIEREAISLNDLRDAMPDLTARPKGSLLEALDSLRRRSLIEIRGTARFTLQPAIMEYVTTIFIEQVYKELELETFNLLASHALIEAQAKNYIRDIQTRVILAPLADRLSAALGKKGCEQKLNLLLAKLHNLSPQGPNPQKVGYAGGNLLNLLLQLQCDPRGYDFSSLPVWQVYLQDVALPDVDFSHADLAKTVFTGTFEGIITIAFNADGTLLATGTSTGEVWIWQVAEGTPLLTLTGHTDLVNSVAFSPDGKLLASGGEDQTIRLWDISTGNGLHVLRGHVNRVHSVAFSPDGKLLASGGDDAAIQVWNPLTGSDLYQLQGHEGWIKSLTFSPDGALLASGSDDHSVRLWELATKTCLHTLQKHTTSVGAVTFDPTGRLLASSDDDLVVQFWDVPTGQPLSILPEQANRLGSIVFSPDGATFINCSDGYPIRIWETSTSKCLSTLQHTDYHIHAFAFSPDGVTIASGGGDQTIQFWDARSAQCLKTIHGYSNWLKVVVFSPLGDLLASCGDDEMICLWNVQTRQCIGTLQGHDGHIRALAFSPNGKFLASGSDDQTIMLWEVGSARRVKTLQGHTGWVWAVAFSPDGKLLASGGFDEVVKLWDTTSGQCLATLEGHTTRIRSVAFSPDSRIVASSSDDQTVHLWDTATHREIRTLQGHSSWVWAIAFSPDGKLLATCSADQTVLLWEVGTGQVLNTLRGHTDRIWAVAFSPDGTLLASGSSDHTIRVWQVATGQAVHILQGHTDWIRSVAFSSDGKLLASCSHDGTIRLWNGAGGEYLATLRNDRPYERMNISGASGLTATQKVSLLALGAIEDRP